MHTAERVMSPIAACYLEAVGGSRSVSEPLQPVSACAASRRLRDGVVVL